jgi:hypothetical protein
LDGVYSDEPPPTYALDGAYIPMPIAYKLRPHGYVSTEDVAKALPQGRQVMEELFATLHKAVSPAETWNKRAIQHSVTQLIGTNGLAAHTVLLQYPDLAPNACRAFTDFAIERAQAHKHTRRVAYVTTGIGLALTVSSFFVPFLAPAAVAVLFGVSATVAVVIAAKAWQNYSEMDRKLQNNVAEVLADEESPEVIITRIPEEIQARNSDLRTAWIDTGLAFLSTFYFLQEVWIAKGVAAGTRTVAPVAGQALEVKEGVNTAKTLLSLAKLSPIALNALSYASFTDYEGMEVEFEEAQGSGVIVHARIESYDELRRFVKLHVLSVRGPNGPMRPKITVIRMGMSDFREMVRKYKPQKPA